MQRQNPRKDELLTVIFQKQISQFFKHKKQSLGFDFFGMAERTPYGSMFASSDPSVATLLYDNDWYSIDPAINRDILKLHNKEIIQPPATAKKYQDILAAKQKQCNQAACFTIPVIQGETELYFCIATNSLEKLNAVKKFSHSELIQIGMEFREYMLLLANPDFELKKEIRECYFYYIVDNTAYEGKDTYHLTEHTAKITEIARFNTRAHRIFRLIGKNFIGFTADIECANEKKLLGMQVEELIIVKNNLYLDYEKSTFYANLNISDTSKKITEVTRPHKLSSLTPQQEKCLYLLVSGNNTKQIANELSLSKRTVEHYLEKIRKITGSRNSREIISKYYQSKFC